MYNKAVICTDLTSESDALVGSAVCLRSFGVREVVLTHVTDVFNRDPKTLDGKDEAAFARQIDLLESEDFRVRVEAPLGHPAFSLREVSKNHKASVIVVGAHGSGMFGAPFAGSISSDLLVLSETPVFVAALDAKGNGEFPDPDCALMSHVLYATDFSETADCAFDSAMTMVGLGASKFTLLHVQDVERIKGQGRAVEEFDRRDTIRLERYRDRLATAGASEVDVTLVHGSPAEELAARAAGGDFSLMIIGSRGRSERADSVLGGVSDRAVRETRTPMLIVPASEESSEGDGKASSHAKGAARF